MKQVTVSNTEELTAALRDLSVDRIWVLEGTYRFNPSKIDMTYWRPNHPVSVIAGIDQKVTFEVDDEQPTTP
jgi:hypothetical protein